MQCVETYMHDHVSEKLARIPYKVKVDHGCGAPLLQKERAAKQPWGFKSAE